MNKLMLLVVLLASALTVGLYTLPTVVVQNENKQLGGGHDAPAPGSGQVGPDSTAVSASESNSVHEKPLSPEKQQQLKTLQIDFANAKSGQKEVIGEKLIALLNGVTRYDSAAYYADLLAQEQPTEQNLVRAGDVYFEAYTFAVDGKKTAFLGQKTRDLYGKALAKNPDLLSAKANMAMTYVNTDTPMQGIMLLREVIGQDPTNELALFDLGLLAMRSNQHEKAVDRFRQILVNNPSSRKAQFYLGISLAEAGKKEEAKKVLAEVKKQEKDPQILAAIREYEERLAK